MKYLLATDQIYFNPSDLVTVRFDKAMTEVSAKQMCDWEGTFKAVICDNLEDGMKVIVKQVREYLKKCLWWDEKYAHLVEVACAFSEISDSGMLWLIPYVRNAQTRVCLAPKP